MADILGNTGKYDAFKSNALTKAVQNGGVQNNNPLGISSTFLYFNHILGL